MNFDVGSWFQALGGWIVSWFSTEQKVIYDYFAPLLDQVEQAALKIGNDNLQVGISILTNAAMAAVIAAQTAPAGTDKVAAAEAAMLNTLIGQGLDAIHNAEAAMIKAAVAIIQTKPELVAAAQAIANTAASNTATSNT